MATLVLSTVGGIVGGPVGAAIGGILGQAIDRDVLFKPKRREGPRLADLRVQTSSYGTPLAQVFGTMRVAGSVIWSTDLIESRSTSHAGKGQPSTTSYSYAASFAVALSARPIVGVGRIWADGKLLRGAAGDWKAETGFRLHLGDEDQPVDPLIAAAEGIALAPAHRGQAYAVFEMLQLADFGNRIPSLTFELIGDATAPGIADVARALAPAIVFGSADGGTIGGFVNDADSVRTALEAVATIGGMRFRPAGDRLEMLDSGLAVERTVADAGISADDAHRATDERKLATIDSVPGAVSVGHYDPARDYQAGLQRVRRAGPGAREQQIAVPAALSASAAKALAAARLAEAENARERRTLRLGWNALDIAPGTMLAVAGEAGRWRVTAASFEDWAVTLECVRDGMASAAAGGSSGRSVGAVDTAAGTTLFEVFELPPLDGTPSDTPQLAIAAAGTEPGWRRAALLLSTDDGGGWTPLAGGTAAPGVIGTVSLAPHAAPAGLIDRRSVLEVELAHAGMTLADADPGAIDAGANLAIVGEELLQFERAAPLSQTRWRLTGLVRGRRGTEIAIGTQSAGDRFVLIERDALTVANVPPEAIGTTVKLLASGVGDVAGPVARERFVTGAAAVPPAPVRPAFSRDEAGGWRFDWVRRSRRGWAWSDGIDAPLAEEAERYRIDVQPPDGPATRREVTEPSLLLTDDEAPAGTVLQVRQIGSAGVSFPATCTVPEEEE